MSGSAPGPVPGRSPMDVADAVVVVPAYDEERVIGRALAALAPWTAPDASPHIDVVVVPNGCHDATADVAREHAGVTVVELETGSKSLALNAGDAAAGDVHPRIYLDADIALSPDAIPALVAALSTPEALVAAPAIRFDVSRSSWPVRAFYEVFAALPYARDGLVGLGVYGLSRAGRARFESFPDLVADDLYVQRLFAADERRTTAGTFTVSAPRTLRSLLAVRVRVAKGNSGLAAHDADDRFAASTGSTSRSLLGLVTSRPAALPAVAVYVGVTLAARALASQRSRTASDATWERDDSTRA